MEFMALITFVGLVVAFIMIGMARSRQKQHERQIDEMRWQIDYLWRRAKNKEEQPQPEAPPAQAIPQQPAYQPPSQPAAQPQQQPAYRPQQQPAYQPPQQPAYRPQQPAYQPLQQPAYQPPRQPAYQPQQQPAYRPPQQPAYQPQPQPAYQPAAKQEQKQITAASTENWIGKYLLGIAASVLVFVGIILLGFLIYDQIKDEIKIALMFVLSAAITGLGVFLNFKKQNAFTKILTGCGCGSFFISIMITHVYFVRLTDIAAFSLLLVWLVAALLMAKWLQSVSLSIVAHIGMILSTCFAYGMGLSDDKLLLLIIYQMVSVVVIVVGNMLCCRKTFRFGVFVSLAMTIVASGFMRAKFHSGGQGAGYRPFTGTELPVWTIAAAFAAQFVCASCLSYLLSVSTNRLKEKVWRCLIHAGNKFLWIAAYFLNMYQLVYRLARQFAAVRGVEDAQFWGIAAAVAVGLLIIILHSSLSVFMSLKLKFKKELETMSVLAAGGVAGILMLILWAAQKVYPQNFPCLSLMLIPALLLALAKLVSRNKAYKFAANVFFAVDLFFMLVDGYRNLTDFTNISLPVCYMLIYLAVIWIQWLRCDKEGRTKHLMLARLLSYLTAEISLIVILMTSELKYRGIIMLITMTALNLLLFLIRYDKTERGGKALYWVMRVNEFLWIGLSAHCIAFVDKNQTTEILYLILAVLAMGLAVTRIKDNLFANGIRQGEEALYIFKIAALIMAPVYGYTGSSDYQTEIMLLSVTSLGLLFYFLRYYLYQYHGRDVAKSELDTVMQIGEFIWIIIVAQFIASEFDITEISYMILAVLTMGLAVTRIKAHLFANGIRQGQEALYIIKIAALVMAAVYSYAQGSDYQAEIMLLSVTSLSIMFYLLRYWLYRYHGRDSAKVPLDIAMRINENLWVAVSAGFIAFADRDTSASNVLYMILAVLALGLAFARIKDVFAARANAFEEVLHGIKLTVLTMAIVKGNTVWFDDQAYVVSLVCMLTALACIVAGFIGKAKRLRLYGLVLTILCVLKLTMFDVAGQDSYLRVICFIGGGIICFAISAIYNYSVKKMNAAQRKSDS